MSYRARTVISQDFPGSRRPHEQADPCDLIALSRHYLGLTLVPGATAVDATVGNGKDTEFLARAVGPHGLVVGFDVQPAALDRTRARLGRAGLDDRVRLHLTGHENARRVLADLKDRPLAAVFNLGWLPGAPRRVVTRPATTLAALQGLLTILAPGGLICVVAYTGHAGGAQECTAVREWCAGLDHGSWRGLHAACANKRERAEHLFLVRRLGPGQGPVRGADRA
jgi:SAM-dependent methyltransferase